MSMIKVMSPDDWDFGVPPTELVKIASGGFSGHDLRQFIKRAGHVFVEQVKHVKIGHDEIPLHLIALGATGMWGANRNGDCFSADTCRDRVDTFVKRARFYRSHLNKDPSKSYGRIKLAAFNEEMQRIELLVALNATKEAAERNGGLIADRELEKLAQGKPLAVSMACSVPYDVCTSCGNKAKTRADYCTEDTCKVGGCKYNLTKVASNGHIVSVENPGCTWIDISDVGKPADRTAYAFRADYLNKAASSLPIGGAALAEAWGLTGIPLLAETSDELLPLLKLAQQLDLWEAELAGQLPHQALGYAPAIQADADLTALLDKHHTKQALAALADQQILLTLRDFLRWQMGAASTSEKVAAVTLRVLPQLPGVFGRLAYNGLPTNAAEYIPDRAHTPAQQQWASKQAAALSLAPDPLQKRAWLASLRQATVQTLPLLRLRKLADYQGTSEQLARQYATYQLAWLAAVAKTPAEQVRLGHSLLHQNQIV